MYRALIRCIPAAVIASGMLLADFSYEQTSKITGGMIAGVMKVAGAFSKEAREPVQSTISVHGDRMWTGNDKHGQIVDLEKETITSIDYQKKTWSVMTFAEMTQALDEMSKKMKEKQQGEVHFKVSAKATGKTRAIAGMDAQEMLLTMEVEGTDQKSGQSGAMVITVDMWLAPAAEGYDEVRQFHRRMAEKLNWTPGGVMGMNRPDIAKGMAEVYKESAKLDGMPVYQETKMTMQGQPGGQTEGQPAQSKPQADDSSSSNTSLTGALAGRLGRLGRKKQQPQDDSAQSGSSGGSGSLLEMTTETAKFSAGPVDAARFEVPAGFKKVQSDLTKMR